MSHKIHSRWRTRHALQHTARPIPRPDRRAGVLLLLGAVMLSCGVVLRDARAQQSDSDASDEVRNCVDLMRIDHTAIVDDDTILFYMNNGQVFRNDLQHRCPTLGSEERFMYRVALSQLCDIDVITVLSDVGFGFMPGASCGLGKFQPIDEQTADRLLEENGRLD